MIPLPTDYRAFAQVLRDLGAVPVRQQSALFGSYSDVKARALDLALAL